MPLDYSHQDVLRVARVAVSIGGCLLLHTAGVVVSSGGNLLLHTVGVVVSSGGDLLLQNFDVEVRLVRRSASLELLAVCVGRPYFGGVVLVYDSGSGP